MTKYRYQSRIISNVNMLKACLRLLLSVSSDRCKLPIDELFYRLGNILKDRNYYNLKVLSSKMDPAEIRLIR